LNNSVRFTLGLDATQVVSGEKVTLDAVNRIEKSFRETFGSKLKAIISVAAIEEAVRRTAEWTETINQTSRAMGVTAAELQTLQMIGTQSGAGGDAVTSMFNNITTAAQEALSGNGEMIASFQALGIALHRSDTQAQIFSRTMEALRRVGVNNPNAFTRQSAFRITGTAEQTAAAISASYQRIPGEGLGGRARGLEAAGNVVPDEQIQRMAAAWADIKNQLSMTAKFFAPLVTVILEFVDRVIRSFSIVNGIFNIVKGAALAMATIYEAIGALMAHLHLPASWRASVARGEQEWLGGYGAAQLAQSRWNARAGLGNPMQIPGLPGAQDQRIMPQIPQVMRPTTSGGANVRIGGMFGAGEERIIRMTQRMIDLLGQIATNTAPWNGNAINRGGTGGMPAPVHQAGGI
jgi:hypothetical protein